MLFDDAPADCQPEACPLVFVAPMQALKDLENALAVLGLDADAVVANRYEVVVAIAAGRDVDARGGVAAELYGVRQKVLQELAQKAPTAVNAGHRIVRDRRVGLADCDGE
jgi:hypothetical protein